MKNPINNFGKNNFVSSAYCTTEVSYETLLFANYMGLKDNKPIKTSPSDMYYGTIRIIEGSCNLIADDKTYHLVKNDLLFIKYFRGFRFVSNSESCRFFFHWFFLNNISLPYYSVFNTPISEEEMEYSNKIINLLKQQDYNSSHIANGYMQILIFTWLKIIDFSQKTPSSQLFDDIRSYINSHLSIRLSIFDIATHFFFTPKYINVIFNKNLGISPKKHITRLIMEKAVFLLKNSFFNISQITFELGFNDVSSFSAAFKKYFHCSPTAYKNNIIKNAVESKTTNIKGK